MSESQPPSPTPELPASGLPSVLSSAVLPQEKKTSNGVRAAFRDFVGWMVAVLWGVSFIVDMLPYQYEVPAPVHAIMMVVVTASFGPNVLKKLTGGGD